MLRWDDCVRRYERKAGVKGVGRRRKETEEGGKDYQMMRWRSCGQHLKHLDKGKKWKRSRIHYVCTILRFGCQLDVRRFLG